MALAQPLPKTDPRRMAAAGLRAFFRIADLWGLSVADEIKLLGEPSRATYFKWKRDPKGAALGRDTLERLSYVLGIYKALQILLPEPQAADTWIKQPNTAPGFSGRSALDRMLSGNVSDLYAVREYLDAQRGGWS